MIIGISGVKESGKNTAAKFIAELFHEEFVIAEWSFARDLKISAMKALSGITQDDDLFVQWANDFKEKGTLTIALKGDGENTISGREYLQLYGTEAHREVFGDDFWVDNLMDKVVAEANASQEGHRLDLITDVRFPNEAKAIFGRLGVVIRVRRPDVEDSGDTHASERPLDDQFVNIEIWNDSDLATFKLRTEVVVRDIVEKRYG